MDNLVAKFNRVFSEFQISKTCNSLLHQRTIDLEQSSLDNTQYLKQEIIEISTVPLELSNAELEGLVCRALFMTGNEVSLDDLEACHHLKKRENFIVKFK